MTTATVTRPAGTLQPRHPLRQIAVVAIFLVAGLSLGMLLDTGRTSGGVDLGGAAQLPAVNATRTAELRLADLYSSQHPLVLQQSEVIGTTGAIYDPITGTVVFDSAIGDALAAEQRLQVLRDSLLVQGSEVGQAHSVSSLSPVFGPGGVVIGWELDPALQTGAAMTTEQRLQILRAKEVRK